MSTPKPLLKITSISESPDEVVFAIGKHTYFFSATGATVSLNGEAEASAAALFAMKSGASMVLDRPVSDTYRHGLAHVGAIFEQWFGFAPLAELSAPPAIQASVKSGSRVGSFFSGGADSLFTLLRHLEEITDLILVIGMDIPL